MQHTFIIIHTFTSIYKYIPRGLSNPFSSFRKCSIYQLSALHFLRIYYRRKNEYPLKIEKKQMASHLLLPEGVPSNIVLSINYSWIVATTPAPTVRPPSRIENLVPSSIAIGAISSTVISMLSPGITISTPSGRLQIPVTSVVRK